MRTLSSLFVALVAPIALASSVSATLAPGGELAQVREEDAIDELVTHGRELLDAYEPERAQPVFEEAVALDGGALRTRQWLLRAWMDQGRNNDTLDELDALRKAGRKGTVLDYLYGMAFTRRAEQQIAAGVTGSSIEMNFTDATDMLERVTTEAPDAYPDAYLALSTSAWYVQRLDLARSAGERSVELRPNDGRGWLQLGRVAMSQFRVAYGDEWTESAEAHWARAVEAFDRAVACFGRPASPDAADDRARLADAALQLGHSHMWKQDRASASDAYATSIAWNPAGTDYGMLYSMLAIPADELVADGDVPPPSPLVHFHRALSAGANGFASWAGERDPADAALNWWLAWTQLTVGLPAEAEETLVLTLAKAPEYVNAWFYLALARFDLDDEEGAIDALRSGFAADPAVIVGEMQSDLELNLWKLSQLVGDALERGELLDCALLSEICAESALTDARHWNNMGLFLRDEADARRGWEQSRQGRPSDPEVLDLYERSYAAYVRALELTPDDPSILNDTAVLLHYYLERDWEKALEMYARANVLAAALLEDETLSEADRELYEIALRDSRNNAEDLKRRIERRANVERLRSDPPL